MAVIKSLIDNTFFEREQFVYGMEKGAISKEIAMYITEYEQDFLIKAMGYTFYKLLVAGLDLDEEVVEQRYKDVVFGGDFVKKGIECRWVGLKQPEIKKSVIAQYVYCHYIRQQNTQTAMTEIKPNQENAMLASSLRKLVKEWNRMMDGVDSLRDFLYYKQVDGVRVYPEYTATAVDKTHLVRKNILGI